MKTALVEKAYQKYFADTREDKTIPVFAETNDNLDYGYPNEYASWNFICKDKESFLKRCGKSHVGCSGIEVIVFLDGKQI